MTKNRSQLMVDRLRELQASSPDTEASAVVSVDGLIMASSLPAGVEEDRVSAMSAAMLSLGERYRVSLESDIRRLSKLMEPMMLVVMGLMVGFLAVSFILPLFRLSRMVH